MDLKLPSLAKKFAKAILPKSMIRFVKGMGRPFTDNAQYWSYRNVTHHQHFSSAEESLNYFHWRNCQYVDNLAMMPVAGQDGKTVLDYGCGPGHDLVGFATYSRPSRLIGLDISARSVAEAKTRLALHSYRVEIQQIVENDERLPLDDASVDYIHSSGVVHHAADPAKVLRELRRVLKPSGKCRIMVYNYDSVWLHLGVAYLEMIRAQAFPGLDVRAAFGKTTDGPRCPISRVYKAQEFIELANPCGFSGRFLGAAISLFEMSQLPARFDAIQDINLPREHRDFLLALQFDASGYPLYNNTYAGVNGYYELTPT